MQNVVMTVGLPASGKSSYVRELAEDGLYEVLSRDKEGGRTLDLLPKLEKLLLDGKSVILDCTFMQAEKRQYFIDLCQKLCIDIHCSWFNTSAEDCQINALHRMWDRHGKVFLDVESLKGVNDPNMFPIVTIFKMKKQFEKPTVEEGFETVEKIKFTRRPIDGHNGKALFLDYDGTLRDLPDSAANKYPIRPSEVIVRPNARETLLRYRSDGYLLFGVSNQSGIGKGVLSKEDAEACFDETNRQLGIDIDYSYCPHRIPPASCYCRKPQAGMAIPYIRKYKLDPAKCLMIGDMTSDRTFATRLGITFIHADEFFKEEVVEWT